MVQNAIVKKIIREGVAEVSLLRQMECGLHCDGACAGCSAKPPQEILALASNGMAVFLLPCVGLGLGYGLGMGALHLSEITALATAFLGLAAGFVPALLMDRAITRRNAPEFAILKQLR